MKYLTLILLITSVLIISCKKDDPEPIPVNNFTSFNGEYYNTVNSYIIPIGTLYTLSIFYLLLTDGTYDTITHKILNYKHLLKIDVNTLPSDSLLPGNYAEPEDNDRKAETFYYAKFYTPDNTNGIVSNKGLLQISKTDQTYNFSYSFTINEDSTIIGKYSGNPEIINLPTNLKDLF